MSDPRLARPLWRGRTNMDALTIAVVEHAEQIKRDRWPDRAELHHAYVITQGSYQAGAGDPNSAGTHDKGGAGDAEWCGHPECVWALRAAGSFASHRTPEQGPWKDHIHFVVVDHPLLAPLAAAQIDDYLASPPRNGLKGHGPDDGPRITPIPRPVWPYPPEDEVTPDDIDKIADKVTKNLLATKVKVTGAGGKDRSVTVEQMLRETFQKSARAARD